MVFPVTEGTDFSGDLAGALSSPLPFGTNQVDGTVTFMTDSSDFFAFTSLLAGSSFTMSFNMGFNYGNFDVIDSLGAHVPVEAAVFNQSSASFTGTVPADGKLVAQVGYAEGSPYTVNLSATTVPEPNSAVLTALGVSAAALRRSRRAKKTP